MLISFRSVIIRLPLELSRKDFMNVPTFSIKTLVYALITTISGSIAVAEQDNGLPMSVEERLIEQGSREFQVTYTGTGNKDADKLYEIICRESIPCDSIDTRGLFVEYVPATGATKTPSAGLLANSFVLKGKIKNPSERFVLYKMVIKVSLEDCKDNVCSPLGLTATKIDEVIGISSVEEIFAPLIFPAPMELKGKLGAKIEIVANWSYIDPDIAARETEEVQAETEDKATETPGVISPAPLKSRMLDS